MDTYLVEGVRELSINIIEKSKKNPQEYQTIETTENGKVTRFSDALTNIIIDPYRNRPKLVPYDVFSDEAMKILEEEKQIVSSDGEYYLCVAKKDLEIFEILGGTSPYTLSISESLSENLGNTTSGIYIKEHFALIKKVKQMGRDIDHYCITLATKDELQKMLSILEQFS